MSSYYDDASLMLLASGGAQKDGKVYSVKPTDGSGDFTFSRGTNLSATRVNASQLIEKGRENLLLQSNNFDTTWTNINITQTSGQTGYDGSSDAWKSSFTAGATRVFGQTFSQTGVITISIYVKAGNHNFIQFVTSTSTTAYVNFDISSSSAAVGTEGTGVIDSNITSVGNDWYRCSMSFNNSSSGTIYVWMIDSATSSRASDISTDGNILIQDAQLEIGLAATEVIETGALTAQAGILENTPRLDYSGGASCPSLLLEPSRSNPIPQSEYIYAGGGYNFTGSAVPTYNAATSPEGKDNATLFNLPVNNAGFYNFATGSAKSVGDKITMSLFAKLKSGSSTNIIKMGYGGQAVGGDRLSEFNLSTGTIVYSHPSADSVSIEDYGNGWYRLIQTQTCIAAGSAGVVVYGGGEIDVYIWGVQSEDASYATSYIPTYGVSQTRAGELCSNLSLTTSTDFTIFFEAKDFCLINGGTTTSYSDVQFVFSPSGSAYDSGGSYHIYANSMYYYDGSTNTNFGVIFNNQTDSKFALVKRGNKGIIYANGVKKTEITLPSGADAKVINWDAINLTQSLTDGQGDVFGSKYQQLLKFDTALSDLDLAILTGATTYNTFAAMALALNYTVYE